MLVAEKEIELNIKLHLPPYSRNLNPIERLCKFMNEKKAINRFFDDILPDIGHELDARIIEIIAFSSLLGIYFYDINLTTWIFFDSFRLVLFKTIIPDKREYRGILFQQ
jgi:hypothetical protein